VGSCSAADSGWGRGCPSSGPDLLLEPPPDGRVRGRGAHAQAAVWWSRIGSVPRRLGEKIHETIDRATCRYKTEQCRSSLSWRYKESKDNPGVVRACASVLGPTMPRAGVTAPVRSPSAAMPVQHCAAVMATGPNGSACSWSHRALTSRWVRFAATQRCTSG
jgi:hypothetical protein